MAQPHKSTISRKVAKGSKNVPIEWNLSGVGKDFARKEDGTLAIFGCGCTGFTDEGKTVKGTYNHEVNGDIEKTFTLFFNDGKDLEVKNDKGVLVRNPLKDSMQLSFILGVK